MLLAHRVLPQISQENDMSFHRTCRPEDHLRCLGCRSCDVDRAYEDRYPHSVPPNRVARNSRNGNFHDQLSTLRRCYQPRHLCIATLLTPFRRDVICMYAQPMVVSDSGIQLLGQ